LYLAGVYDAYALSPDAALWDNDVKETD
jgi:hypothetical protein